MLSKRQITKALIGLRECIDWSAPLLFACNSQIFLTTWDLAYRLIFKTNILPKMGISSLENSADPDHLDAA